MEDILCMSSEYALKNQCAQQLSVGQYIPPTHRQRLEQKKDALLGELKRVDAALDALDAHPELEQFTNTLAAALR